MERNVYRVGKKRRLGLSGFLSFLFIFLITSCNQFNTSVYEYLEHYSDEAFIGGADILEKLEEQYEGIDCIESNGDKIITLWLANPQEYNIIANYHFDDSRINEDFIQDGVSLTQSENKCSITLRFSKAFLDKVDIGTLEELDNQGNSTGRQQKNLSGFITLVDADSGRVFSEDTPFHLSVMVDSTPPRAQGAVFQKLNSKYVICFNLPVMNGTVHEKDTKDLYVGNRHFNIVYSGNSMSIQNDDGTVASEFSITSGQLLSGVTDLDGSASTFVVLPGCNQIYYKTDIDPSTQEDEISYKITLKDDYDFDNPVTVSNQMAKLEQPTINFTSSDSVSVRETDGKADLIISHTGNASYKDGNGEVQSKQCPSPVIEYEIFDDSGHSVKSGHGAAPVTVSLERGKYYVEAYAQAEGFCDGDKYTGFGSSSSSLFKIKPPLIYYVRNTGNSNNNGSSLFPFDSIDRAIQEINTNHLPLIADGSVQYTIRLLSDISSPATISNIVGSTFTLDGNNYKINLNGATESALIIKRPGQGVLIKNLTVTGAASGDDGAVKILQAGSLELQNCKITGNTGFGVNTFISSLKLTGNTQIINNKEGNVNKNLYIPDGKHVTIGFTNSPKFSGRIGFTTQTNPTPPEPIKITSGFSTGAAEGLSPYDAFIPDDSINGCVVYKTNEVWYSSSVSSFEIYDGETLTVFTDGSFTAGGSNSTITVTVQDGNATDISSQCTFGGHMILYMSDIIPNATNYYYTVNGNKVTLKNTLEIGTGYELFIQITYKGVTYDALLPFTLN